MATIHVDGEEYEVDGAENLLQACLSLGLDIPYFCWHPALGSVGACRQCAVKQFQGPDDKRGRLVMSCMTPASDGSYIAIEDEEAKKFREAVVEFLMVNHPHDCPVCEEGGNCHLQDMTVMTGHSFRKYRFNKRTHNNQELGPFINHEMNRCIACYRCVRYYKDYAGGEDFGVYGSHDNVYFGRPEDGTLESEFSGNLVEVCPTGVFTDKTHSERYNRKWDMQFAPSICQQCSVGCNTSPGERYGELRRIENRYNGTVNHYFLCDRGRFGYGYVNLKDRPRSPQQLRGQDWIHLNPEQAMEGAADVLRQSKKTIGIGSPRASLESNYALRQLVGAENYSNGMEAGELARVQLMQKVLRESGLYTPSLREMEGYDAVLVLGEDVTQTGARIALALRQAVKGKAREMAAAQRVADWQIAAVQNIGQHAKYPLFVTNIDSTRLDDVAAWNYSASVAEQARLGFAIAQGIDSSAPAVADLPASLKGKVDIIVQALSGARKPLIVTGSGAGSEEIIQAATNIALALKKQGLETGITFVAAESNSMGVAMIGGSSIDDALTQIENGEADTLIVMENDLYRHASRARIDAALAKVENLIVVDHQRTEVMDKATLILSAASFAESDGTLVNQEGRAQRFFQVYEPSFYDKDRAHKSYILESWRWLHSLDSVYNSRRLDWTLLDHVVSAVAQEFPLLAGIVNAAPDASFRIKGLKIAREPHRYSGRTAMMADVSVHEKRQPQDNDTAFAYSMEGYSAPEADRQQIPFAWAPGWNSPQAWNKFQSEVGGKLRSGDPGVRLIEKAESGELAYFDAVVNVPTGGENSWLVAPYYHLFGSDEMSQRSDVIQQRMPEAYVMLNPQDAAKLSVNTGSVVAFSCEGSDLKLPVRISDTLEAGFIGLPLGLPGISPALVGKRIDNLKETTV
ncbi:NADH-quinone oxidoreductase subunit NuoG [Budviciaceae bacterium CWB-B4]|uniref:NADH-quinone oxidoreductase n=1 Tax=Limnobaculum xujianqingii TaxID=2738837 RepID=A0A9D7FUK9_9GAMM|nr:NADH-quinone oxidoreductase subunit NuoG [Limnobaculum xujianqingii]MBK5073954.1 NADH-quinone oxidoreductase subunit NuoG [Limnobaculum xujianqingii]MBK5177152.1 NADH-quinone oxidoreductase subunit NuoG [Limnobaculum xujianqingii]